MKLLLGNHLLSPIVFISETLTDHELSPEFQWTRIILRNRRVKIESFGVAPSSKRYLLSPITHLQLFYHLPCILALLFSNEGLVKHYHLFYLGNLQLDVAFITVLEYLCVSDILGILGLKLLHMDCSFWRVCRACFRMTFWLISFINMLGLFSYILIVWFLMVNGIQLSSYGLHQIDISLTSIRDRSKIIKALPLLIFSKGRLDYTMVSLDLWLSPSNFLTHFFGMIALTSRNNMRRSIDMLEWFIFLRLGFNTFIMVIDSWLRWYIFLCIRFGNIRRLFFHDWFGELILVLCHWKLPLNA